MKINSDQYVPILKWKQAEYMGLKRLDKDVKDKIVPLCHIPPRDYSYELGRLKKSLDEHVGYCVDKLDRHWGKRKAFIDFHQSLLQRPLMSGRSFSDVFFGQAEQNGASIIPVIYLDSVSSYLTEVRELLENSGLGCCIRIRLEEALQTNVATKIEALLNAVGAERPDVDLVLDLGAPDHFTPYADLCTIVTAGLTALLNEGGFRTVIVSSTSYPEIISSVVDIPGAHLERHEWTFYQHLRRSLPQGFPQIIYSDYGIDSPSFREPLDMRKIKINGKLVD